MRKLKGITITFEIFHVLKYEHPNGATAHQLHKTLPGYYQTAWGSGRSAGRDTLGWNAGHVWNALRRLEARGWVSSEVRNGKRIWWSRQA